MKLLLIDIITLTWYFLHLEAFKSLCAETSSCRHEFLVYHEAVAGSNKIKMVTDQVFGGPERGRLFFYVD